MSNRQTLSNWLQNELHARNWSQSELARVSGLHRAIVSKIILGESKPTPETLEAIAKAFKLPPEQVYRVAGILPQVAALDQDAERIVHEVGDLTAQEKEEVLAFIHMKCFCKVAS
jgi:Plasmid maintenance system antidote protein